MAALSHVLACPQASAPRWSTSFSTLLARLPRQLTCTLAPPCAQVEEEGLAGGYGGVQPGDCVVAFSRKDIYTIKQYIEQETKHRACVVYGALPPETRRQQAKLFNEPGGPSGFRERGCWVGLMFPPHISAAAFAAPCKHPSSGPLHLSTGNLHLQTMPTA